MGQRFTELSDKLITFIQQQQIFFVATATDDSRINISPKGMDTLKVINKNRVVWLNVTGSGNETATHLIDNKRMTMMFCAFDGNPLILRLYGEAKAIHKNDSEWPSLYAEFTPQSAARQIFDLKIELVQSSCGMAVPFFDYVKPRDQLKDWADKKTNDEIKTYWQEKNQISLDGKPSHIIEKNT